MKFMIKFRMKKQTMNAITIDDTYSMAQREFELLYARWKKDTLNLSSVSAIVGHPDYQRMIEMGEPIVHLLLHKLIEGGALCCTALSEITNTELITEETAGDVPKMQSAWIRWAMKNGYLFWINTVSDD